jgi:hypothetical protein
MIGKKPFHDEEHKQSTQSEREAKNSEHQYKETPSNKSTAVSIRLSPTCGGFFGGAHHARAHGLSAHDAAAGAHEHAVLVDHLRLRGQKIRCGGKLKEARSRVERECQLSFTHTRTYGDTDTYRCGYASEVRSQSSHTQIFIRAWDFLHVCRVSVGFCGPVPYLSDGGLRSGKFARQRRNRHDGATVRAAKHNLSAVVNLRSSSQYRPYI